MTPRGYAFPLVLVLLLLLATALTTALLGVAGSVSISESALHRRQAFHAAEGAQVAAVELAAQRLRTLPLAPDVSPNDPAYNGLLAALLEQNRATTEAFVNAELPALVPEPYTVGSVRITGLRAAEQTLLDAGPFAGMLAQVQRFRVSVDATRTHERSQASVGLDAEVQRATISMFQFYVFADDYLDLDPGGPVTATGRIHTNGDFCIAGEPVVDTITAAGRILISNPNSHGQCRLANSATNNIRIAIDDSFTTFRTLTIDHTAGAAWNNVATDFNRHLLDSQHRVGTLRMPISGEPRVQAGASVLAMEQGQAPGAGRPLSEMVPHAAALEANTSSMRFLVDPVLVNEPEDVRRQKLAFKADVRIIDGVWFVRDEANPRSIGTPVWSDHVGPLAGGYPGYPGQGGDDIIEARMVGQDNVRDSQSWGASTPQLFSYYGFTDDGGQYRWTRAVSTPAVISYGLLHNAGDGRMVPGRFTDLGTPHTTAPATTLEHFIDATRTGFKNGWIEARSESDAPDDNAGASTIETRRSRILPINFDVSAFINALTNACGSKELGSYFPGSCSGSGRRFNGVVYVSSTWPGSMRGLGTASGGGSTFAHLWPFQPATADSGLRNPSTPMPLCGSALRPLKEGAGGTVRQAAPCGSMTRSEGADGTPTGGAFPSFVRVINAKHINPRAAATVNSVTIRANALPSGLTIATNLPIAVVGDANIDTVPQTRRTTVPAGAYFVPFLIAGDRFHRHSKSWNDAAANWRESMAAQVTRRNATTTTQHLEILAGWNPTPKNRLSGHGHSSDGFEDFPRYNERWSCAPTPAAANYFGSIVVAFASVYERTGANNDDGHNTSGDFTTCFPGRNEGFDFQLEDPRNQPPGAPLILAQSIGFVSKR